MSFPLLEFHLLEYNGTWYRLLAHFGRTNSFCIYISFLVHRYTQYHSWTGKEIDYHTFVQIVGGRVFGRMV